MMTSAPKKPGTRAEREARRMSLAAPAWALWTALARNDVMDNEQNKLPMLERHKIVVSLIELNSQQLRCDSAAAGLDIERLTAVRDLDRNAESAECQAAVAEIDRRMAEVDDKKRKLAQERDWLETSLRELDAALPDAGQQPKNRNDHN